MKKKHFLIIGILLLLLVGGYFIINNLELKNNTFINQQSKANLKIGKSDVINRTFTWSELDIIPIKTVEGSNYVFSAFDYDISNNELVIARSAENHYLMFINDSNKTELQISDIPLDISVKNGDVYVLGLSKFIIVSEKKIAQEFTHNIPNVTAFDKLIFFNGKPTILMADGSSYRLKNNNFIKSNSLDVNNTEVWIQKVSPNSFEIKSKPESQEYQKQVNYDEEIGSISFLGEDLKEYYVVLDKIKYNGQRPYVQRELKSSKDNFKETIIKLPVRDFTFIKNDIKIHNDTIYTIIVTDNNLNIKSYN